MDPTAGRDALAGLGQLADELVPPGEAFGHWVASTTTPNGARTMPYVEYGPLERRFREAVGRGGWVRPEIDWQAWAGTDEARGFRDDPRLIAAATEDQLAHLLTWIIRGDRFNEGSLLAAFESGALAAVARRARALAERPATQPPGEPPAEPGSGRPDDLAAGAGVDPDASAVVDRSPIAAAFTCGRCGELAATVTLVPPGGRHPFVPEPGEPGFDPGRAQFVRDAWQLALDGPTRSGRVFLPSMDVDLGRLSAVLRSGDPVALYGLDREYAPFWCPTCALAYCPAHWTVWIEDDEGFYDCTRGRCVEGHERILDD